MALAPSALVAVDDLPPFVLKSRPADAVEAPVAVAVEAQSTTVATPAPGRSDAQTLAESKDHAELEAITQALQSSGYNRSRAAQKLGISRPTLYKKLRRYGLLNGNPGR